MNGVQAARATKHPAQIGPYRIRGVLGTGGMGIVYDAVHGATGQPAAVKTLRSLNRKFINGLRTEVLALRGVSHPLVVSILEDGLLETPPWYSMQRIEGRTLAEFNTELWGQGLAQSQTMSISSAAVASASSEGRWSLPRSDAITSVSEAVSALPLAAGGALAQVLEIFCRLCEPLWHVHARGIVHRDLKPSNILLGHDNAPIIMDFGLASRSLSSSGRGRLEIPNDMGGSAPYMAPEQVRGQSVDARADLYAFGCMLYEVVTGRPPFVGATQREVAYKHLSEVPLAPSKLVRGLPSAVEQVILRLLEKDPKARIGHADHLANALASAGGYSRPAPAKVGSPVYPYLYRPSLAGRAGAVDAISQACASARAGAGSLIFVGGESGIGKTFLATEGGRLASLLGMQVITGECLQLSSQSAETETRASPLHPLRRLMQLVVDRCREQPRAVGPRLLAAARTLSTYEPALLSIAGPVEEAAPPLPPEAARNLTLGAVLDMLDVLAQEAPILFILDDVQWADELSLTFIEALAGGFVEHRPIALMCLYRVEEVPDALARILRQDGVCSLRLSRLGADSLASLVSDMLAMDRAPGELVEFIHRRSEGNPFFAAEYLRLLADEGVIRRSEGSWSFSGPDAAESLRPGVAAPQSIVDLARRRLAKLGGEARRVACAAAIMGREFDDEALARVANVDEASLGIVLGELTTNQVLERAGDGAHRFVHDQLRAVISVEVAPAERCEYHRAFGHLLRNRPDADLYLPELAHHFRRAGELSLAIEYLEKAGYQALSRFANGEAVKSFKELIELASSHGQLPTDLRHARWEKALGEALHGLGRLEESAQHLKRAAKLLGYPVADRAPLSQLELLRQLGVQLVHRMSSGAVAEPDAERRIVCREASQTYDRLSQIAYYRGLPVDMFNATLHTLNLAERGGPSPELAMAYAIAHAVAGILPVRALAETYLASARATLSQHPDACVDSYLQLLVGVYRSGTGEWTRARKAIDRGLGIAEHLHFQRRRDELRLALANWHFLLGQWDEALAQTTAESVALRQQDPQAEAWHHLMAAQLALVSGVGSGVDEHLRRAGALRAKLQRSELIWLCGLEAQAAWAAGERAAAQDAATAALDHVLAGPPVTFYCIEAYSMICDVWLGSLQAAPPLERGSSSPLGRKARSACKALAAFARVFPAAVPRYLLRDGVHALLSQRPRAAQQSWMRGVFAARQLGVPLDELSLRWELARALPRGSVVRNEQRAMVLARAEALRARPLVARINRDME